ncbi:hypothetical protein [Mycobacterium gastri]|uniref:Uncharacterized protein n=1 Tax=Mycobacterium gastri TaxID=1777 RepID=A0A1X1VQ37_MYCGS|nr:hypothetical protein [Mycobacterium gastri]ETW26505.1 hypothetical protein MGAST_18100 [Mycobacterium gastri 'Wayne']ORV71099.1 hypothetical protein AWC07_04950 [Mycobacterium gastri]
MTVDRYGDNDPELRSLRRELSARFDARPANEWPVDLLRALIRVFDLAGIKPAPEPFRPYVVK